MYFLGYVDETGFLRILQLPPSESLTPPPQELIRLGFVDAVNLIGSWWPLAVAMAVLAFAHMELRNRSRWYETLLKQQRPVRPGFVGALAVTAFLVVAIDQAFALGQSRALAASETLQQFDFTMKGQSPPLVLSGRVIRFAGGFFVLAAPGGHTVLVNAGDVSTAATKGSMIRVAPRPFGPPSALKGF
jgi:hypothetical protein